MGRRVVVVVGLGAAITLVAVVVAARGSYTDFDPKTTIPELVALGGVLLTAVSVALVLIGTLSEQRATRRAEEATRALRDRERELVQSNRELERFATIAAHDLQEPLRTILTFTSLIERRHGADLEGEALDYLLRVSAAGQRMKALIEDLLIYARVGQAERRFELVDLDDVVREAQADLESLIAESGAVIHVDPLPIVRGNRQALVQLFANLLSNAMKYRLERPVVSVTATTRDDQWVISVADNGRGIDPANHDRIFELFRRLEPGGGPQGTGLGLAICGRVVDLHGGRIWVRSSVGQGATFSFTLPVTTERRRGLRREAP